MYNFVDDNFEWEGEPIFKVRGMYLNTVCDQPPLTGTDWPFYRWKEFIDMSHKLKLNMFDICLWPSTTAHSKNYNMVYSKDCTTLDIETKKRVRLYKDILEYAKSKKMKTNIIFPNNYVTKGMTDTNQDLIAVDKDGVSPQYDLGIEEFSPLCWSKPKAREIIIDVWKEQIKTYQADMYTMFFRDPGGCFCDNCKKFQTTLDISETFRKLIKGIRPKADININTWQLIKNEFIFLAKNSSKDIIFTLPTQIQFAFPGDKRINFSVDTEWDDKELSKEWGNIYDYEEWLKIATENGHKTFGWVENDMNQMQPYPIVWPERFKNAFNLLRKNKASGCSNYLHTPDTKIANIYCYARLLWNPDLDSHEVLREFCKKYYGDEKIETALYPLDEYVKYFYQEFMSGWDREMVEKRIDILKKSIDFLENISLGHEIGKENLRNTIIGLKIRKYIDESSIFYHKANELYKNGSISEAKKKWQDESNTYIKAVDEAYKSGVYSTMLYNYNHLDKYNDYIYRMPPWERPIKTWKITSARLFQNMFFWDRPAKFLPECADNFGV